MGDTAAPQLISASVTPNPVLPGQTFTITWRLTDESGVTFTTAFVRNPSGGAISGCGGGGATRTAGTALDGTYTQTCTLSAAAPGGTYGVQIQAEEPNGNTYFAIPTNFTVTAGAGDTAAPQLISASVTPNPVLPGQTFTITWRLTDESGVTFTTAFVRNPSGGAISGCGGGGATRTAGTALDGTYTQTCTLAADAPSGTYGVQIQAEEPNGNTYFAIPTSFTVSP